MADLILTAPAPAQAFSIRQIAKFYFSPFLDEEGETTGFKQCKACGKCRKHTAGMSYTNLVSHKASHPYGWLRWIITSNLPFSFCESQETRFTNLTEIPGKFGLMLDGWSHETEHFLALFACYDITGGPRYPLLSMAPVIDELDDQLNAEGHKSTSDLPVSWACRL
ncbi:hypothetical protein F443_21419 [Phytophthora nicotianae P1569]|uniref:BED-type domain-containing protein n=2 Tax=Phytophthora nicotianae TaxID=4792 RepID=V9DXL6_PHYNI|nr:hypothetical protein F443_21419 [Phytophthora nicotianae P1569]